MQSFMILALSKEWTDHGGWDGRGM